MTDVTLRQLAWRALAMYRACDTSRGRLVVHAERDSGLLSAPESELLHEVVRLRNELAGERRRRIALESELATLKTSAVLYMAWQHQRQLETAS